MEDYITRLGGDLKATYSGSNVDIRGNYLAQLNSFANHQDNNVVTQDGSFDFDLTRWFQKSLKKGEMTVTEDITFTPDLKDYYFDETRGSIGVLSSYGIRTRRSDVFRNAFAMNLSLPVTNRVNFSTSYSNLVSEYKNPAFRDNVTNTIGAGIGYAFPKDNMYSNVSVSNIREEKDDSNSYSLVLGDRRSVSPLTTFDINAGVVTVDHEARGSDSTFRGGITLTKRSRAHTYNAGYSRTLNTTSGISVTPTVAEIFYVNINNTHTEELTSTIGADYAANRSIKGGDVDTHSYNLTGSLNYTIMKWLRSSLSLSHFNQASGSPAAADIHRNQLTLTFVGTWD